MAEVEVRQGKNGLEHKHSGYPGWHPVNQKHKGDLHASLGITGKEKPTRDREPLGVKEPGKVEAPKRIKPIGQTSDLKPSGIGAMVNYNSPSEYFKAYAKAKPERTSFAGNVFFNTMNAMFVLYNKIKERSSRKDQEAIDTGFYNALAMFDEIVPFRAGEDLSKLSPSELRHIDNSLVKLVNEKYAEYGGKDLKGLTDRDSIKKKVELRAYLDMIDSFRKQSRNAQESQSGNSQATGGRRRQDTSTPTAGQLR